VLLRNDYKKSFRQCDICTEGAKFSKRTRTLREKHNCPSQVTCIYFKVNQITVSLEVIPIRKLFWGSDLRTKLGVPDTRRSVKHFTSRLVGVTKWASKHQYDWWQLIDPRILRTHSCCKNVNDIRDQKSITLNSHEFGLAEIEPLHDFGKAEFMA
jgi:hypothetical protein